MHAPSPANDLEDLRPRLRCAAEGSLTQLRHILNTDVARARRIPTACRRLEVRAGSSAERRAGAAPVLERLANFREAGTADGASPPRSHLPPEPISRITDLAAASGFRWQAHPSQRGFGHQPKRCP